MYNQPRQDEPSGSYIPPTVAFPNSPPSHGSSFPTDDSPFACPRDRPWVQSYEYEASTQNHIHRERSTNIVSDSAGNSAAPEKALDMKRNG